MAVAAGNIVWLASFPKSGNTWLRAMISALLHPEQILDDLNAMRGGRELIERQYLDDICGVDSANLSYEQLLPYLRTMRLVTGASVTAPYFSKTHDRFGYTADGLALFPAEASKLAILIVRNPFDVAISLAAHYSRSVDDAIDRLSDPDFALNNAPYEGHELLPVSIGDWSGFNQSWLNQQALPLLVLRYEDMLIDSAGALRKVADAAGIAVSSGEIQAAVDAASFERLRAAESRSGFAERPTGMPSFFREGRAGGWRERLNARQIAAISDRHAAMLQRLGYAI
jgi:aryl sulfotransferase